MNGNRCLIIAEVGVNHNGSVELAKQYIAKAKQVGADIVKFQTFRAENLVTASAPKANYQERSGVKSKGQFEMLKALELSFDDHLALRDLAYHVGIEYLSTPFDEDALQFLVGELDVKRVKISSGEITNAPLLVKAGRSRKPIILSTGMSTLDEVRMALGALAFGMCTEGGEEPSLRAFAAAERSVKGRAAIEQRVTILHCTTEYPAPMCSINLNAMATINREFDLPVGLSDHSEGILVPIAAVAMGAKVIEKHVTFDRGLPGPDHKASLEMDEFAKMIVSIREVEAAMGDGHKVAGPEEVKNLPVVRKSVVARCPIPKGEAFGWHNLAFKRPGYGRSPFSVYELLGKVADRSYDKDELIG